MTTFANMMTFANMTTFSESRELNINFFQSVMKIDWFDPNKYVKCAKAIFYNWNNFLNMFN